MFLHQMGKKVRQGSRMKTCRLKVIFNSYPSSASFTTGAVDRGVDLSHAADSNHDTEDITFRDN